MAVEITRTPSSNGNQKIWTWSGWIKKATVGMGSGDYQMLFTANIGSGSRYTDVFFREDYFEVFGGVYSTSTTTVDINVSTNRKFRDPSAFYHLVVAVDTTQATAANRVKIYVNGVQETSLKNYQGSSVVYPAQNNNTFMNVTTAQNRIGASGGSYPFKGLMTHVHFVDGIAYTPSTFGESDSTSGIWKPKTNPSVTYGTNGFFLKFENSGNMDLDSGDNNLTFSTSGTLTQNVDTPSNNFATWNALDNYYASATLTNGNTKVATNSSAYSATLTSLGASSGKYYAEFKLIDKGSGYCQIGIKGKQPTATSDGVGAGSDGLAYRKDGYKVLNGSSSTYGTSYDNNDIIGIAMDLDNNRLFFSKNGTFQDSGDPTSSTGAITIPTSSSGFYFMGISDEHNNGTNTWEANFGNGYFGTTAVASAGTAPSEGGIFEYDCPSGYQALCTKGINSF